MMWPSFLILLTGEGNLESWKDGVLHSTDLAQAPSGHASTLVLAGNRTRRPDFLSGFHKYRGGWDIANKHYWAVSTILFLCPSFVIDLSRKYIAMYLFDDFTVV